MTTATPAKLRDGSWGVRARGSVQPGAVVRVVARGGKEWDAMVARVLWTGADRDGSTISLCATRSSDSVAGGQHRSRRGTWTGCSCGSRTDDGESLIPSARNCDSCERDA